MTEVSPADPVARELAKWLLSEHPQTRSHVLMDATARLLRDLADLAEANARRARAALEWGRGT